MKHVSCGWWLKILLWLIALHSVGYGIGLILFPPEFFAWFGFTLPEKFFADQRGVFHIVIAGVYVMAALDLPKASRLIFLTCIIKFGATIFLFAWYIFGIQLWIILVSGLLDLAMGLCVMLLFLCYRNRTTK